MLDSRQQSKGGFGAFVDREKEGSAARVASAVVAPPDVVVVPTASRPFSVTKEASSTLAAPELTRAGKTTDAPPPLAGDRPIRH